MASRALAGIQVLANGPSRRVAQAVRLGSVGDWPGQGMGCDMIEHMFDTFCSHVVDAAAGALWGRGASR